VSDIRLARVYVQACRQILDLAYVSLLAAIGADPVPDFSAVAGMWNAMASANTPEPDQGCTECGEAHSSTTPHAELADEQPVVYTMPGPPPIERRVLDRTGLAWHHAEDDQWYASDSRERTSWVDLLADRAPLILVSLTDEERESERMYGPLGARWGDPTKPCPYIGCRYRLGHIGGHVNRHGDVMLGTGVSDAGSLSVSPQEAAETLCTCGHPEAHRPGCPRYERISGEQHG